MPQIRLSNEQIAEDQLQSSSFRKRRVLVVNEAIEIDLGTCVDENNYEKEIDREKTLPTCLEEPETPTHVSEIIYRTNTTKIYNNHEIALTSDMPNFIVKECPSLNNYRKIAPKECPPLVVDEEIWRVGPPRKKPKTAKESKKKLVSTNNTKSSKVEICKKQRKLKQAQIVPKKQTTKTNEVQCDSQSMEMQCEEVSIQESPENLELENEIGLIQCPYCNYKSPRESIIKKHMMLYHTELSRCPFCDYQSTSTKLLSNHISKHNEDSLKCFVCDATFKQSLNLRSHFFNKHFKLVFENCVICGMFIATDKVFSNQVRSIRDHIKKVHNKEEEIKYECPICDFKTILDLELKSHIYITHNNLKGNLFQCLNCYTIVMGISEFLNHLKKHRKNKVFNCHNCKFLCFSEVWMRMHERTHLRSQYSCPHCKFRTRQHCLLKYHMLNQHKRTNLNIIKSKTS